MNEDRNADFDGNFPLFIFALRDFSLDLEIDGKEVTADEYLEHCLALKKDDSDAAKSYNKCRIYLRKYFKRRKCFTFDRPTSRYGSWDSGFSVIHTQDYFIHNSNFKYIHYLC